MRTSNCSAITKNTHKQNLRQAWLTDRGCDADRNLYVPLLTLHTYTHKDKHDKKIATHFGKFFSDWKSDGTFWSFPTQEVTPTSWSHVGPSFFAELLRGWRPELKWGAQSRGKGQQNSGGGEREGPARPKTPPECVARVETTSVRGSGVD